MSTRPTTPHPRSGWTRGKVATLSALLAAVTVMFVLVSYSVTLYRLFCAATGYDGTTGRAAGVIGAASPRMVNVAFSTSVAPGMRWRFVPAQGTVHIHLGQESLAFFEAENLSDHPIVGHATFNVTPDKAGIYFKKIQCFCFSEERLAPHQKVEMPVVFFVDKRMADDASTSDVRDITLSYTFFISRDPARAADLSRFANAPPDPVFGQTLFAEHCAACHGVNAGRAGAGGAQTHGGPSLAGLFDRPAAAVAGYPYSAALAHSGLRWTPAALDTWLRDPQADVPGSAMGLAVPGAQARRDLIAYLRTLRPALAAPPPARHAGKVVGSAPVVTPSAG